MRFPSKVTSYKESSLSKLPVILNFLSKKKLTPYELYKVSKKYFQNIEEFINVLDCLFALNRLSYDESSGVLYVI